MFDKPTGELSTVWPKNWQIYQGPLHGRGMMVGTVSLQVYPPA